MKKISEMTMEELQDYAVQLKGENETLTASVAEKDQQIDEVNKLNRQLQSRNNSLFMMVEQQSDADEGVEKEKEKQEEKTESCEDFARRLLGGK